MAKVKPNDKNMHAGHRSRVIESYSRIDLDALSPHQVLEFILFYIFPRGDVNPLAHRLLDKFGTVQNVLNATPTQLCEVYGINKRSAQMLAGFVNIFDFYTASKLSRKRLLATADDVFDYCEELLRLNSNESMFGIALDAGRHVIAVRQIGESGKDLVALDTHEVFDFANMSHAANIIFCHSHPNDSCAPSENDILGNKIIKDIIICMGIGFVDHIIIGDDGIYSMENDKMLKSFT